MSSKIEIVWHPSEALEVAAQKGMSHNITIIVDGNRYTISFIEFGVINSVLEQYRKDNKPLDIGNFLENGLVIEAIQDDCILKSVESLIQFGQLKEFPFLPG